MWPEGVHAINNKKILFPHYEPVNLKDKIPDMSEEGADLVSRMLVNNPKKRINMLDVIKHPYFNKVDELLPKSIVDYIGRVNYKP
jgi:serine/threonine protein kinase